MIFLPDDAKLFKRIVDDGDRALLKTDIDTLVKWSDKRLLVFHRDKWKVMHAGVRNIIVI